MKFIKLNKSEIYLIIIIFILLNIILIFLGPSLIYKIKDYVRHYGNSFFDIKTISIKLDTDEIIELSDQNNFFINENFGVLDKDFNYSVKAKLIFNDKVLNGKLKLNGQTSSHREIFSFSFESKNKIFEESSNLDFSFRTFHERPIYDHLISKFFKEKGMLATQIEYYNLKVNGKDFGVYAVQDNINDSFLEDNNFRSGPVIALRNYHFESQYITSNSDKLEEYTSGYFEDVNNDTKKTEISQIAIDKLTHFFNNRHLDNFDLSKNFDLFYWAKYFAICELYLCYDLDTQDIRFYFDPIIEKFIPILDDPHSNLSNTKSTYLDSFRFKRGGYLSFFESHNYFILNSFFSNNQFLNEFNRQLELLLTAREIPNSEFIKRIKFADSFKNFNSEYYLNRFEFLENKIKNEKIFFSNLDMSKNNDVNLNIDLIENIPISLKYLSYKNKIIYEFKENFIDIDLKKPKISFNYLLTNFKSKLPNENLDEIFIHFEKVGFAKQFKRKINTVRFFEPVYDQKNLNFEYLKFNQKGRQIKCPEIMFLDGFYELENYYELDCSDTKEIHILGDSSVTLNNKIILGNLDHPIKIFPNNKNFNFDILNTKNLSILNNVEIVGTINNLNNLYRTGIFTFYNTNIEINKFISNNSNTEDLINCIRSKISISNLNIINTSSDAVDFDFCDIKVSNVEIKNAKGDGLDFSYTTGLIENIIVDNSGDKGLSVGENSIINAKNLVLSKNLIGIAIKDGSLLKASNIIFDKNEYDLLSYNKKNGYKNTSTYLKNIKSNLFKAFNEKNHIIEIDNAYFDRNEFDFSILK